MVSKSLILDQLLSIPQVSLSDYSYSDAQRFSKNLDELLGFQIDAVESQILENSPHTPWAGLEPQALQTPYAEIRMMLNQVGLQPEQTVVDLGAAYGRMGLVMAAFHPESRFIGFEISPERVEEGNRIYNRFEIDASFRIQLLQEDISRSDWVLPEADVYFIYDFGDLESIIRVIDRLKMKARQRKVTVVGRGRRSRDHIERQEPWLSQVIPPVHCGNFSIYQSS